MTINTPFPPRPPSFTPWDEPDRVRRKSSKLLGSRDEPIDRCDHCGAVLLRLKGNDRAAKLVERLLEELVRFFNRSPADG